MQKTLLLIWKSVAPTRGSLKSNQRFSSSSIKSSGRSPPSIVRTIFSHVLKVMAAVTVSHVDVDDEALGGAVDQPVEPRPWEELLFSEGLSG